MAFSIPLLASIHKENPSNTQTHALVLTPTRELAEQVQEVVNTLHPDINPVCIIGGVDMDKQVKRLAKDARVVVGTPGRVLDLIKQKELNLKKCRFFALDEADEMLSMGFLEDVRAILSRLPNKRQGLFVSATITPRVDMLANSFLSKPEQILLESDDDLRPEIDHLYFEVGSDLMSKPSALSDIIETRRPTSAIIFCNTKSDTQLVEALLRRRGFDARRLNSDLSQGQRQRVMRKIKDKELQFLIATDIAARGIDIDEIELVVNYAIHEQPETYVHRTGRTGRAGKKGTAISLIGARDFGSFHFIKKVLNDIEFKKEEAPTENEVADARLAHLYEILRTSEIETSARDELVAEKLLKESGFTGEINDDLKVNVAKLCKFAVEHHVMLEAKSLEEELEQETEPKESKKKSRDKKKRDRDSRQERDDSDEEESEPKRSYKEDVRVYVGAGVEQKLTAKKFIKLVEENCELEAEVIKATSFRDNYGFVDLEKSDAEILIEKLNGFEFEGSNIPVELACSLKPNKPRRHQGRKSHGGRGNSDRRRHKGSGNRSRRGGDRRKRERS